MADKVGWTRFEAAVARAEALGGPALIDPTAELVARHKSVRVFAPRLLDTFAFEGSPAVQDLMAALDLIHTTYRDGKRKLPTAPPLRFVPQRWRAFVLDQRRVDRAAYELCAFSGLRDRFRAGGFEDHLAERSLRLEEAAAAVAVGVRAGTVPEIRLDEAGLTITPLRALTPPAVKTVRQALYDRLPRVRVTDVLLDVDAWTGFSECFTHRWTGRTCDDRAALLTCVLADGINLGLTRMAETYRGASLRQLALVHDWHVSEAAYAEALARLIDAHRALPLSQLWGDSTRASSDGQHFFAGGPG